MGRVGRREAPIIGLDLVYSDGGMTCSGPAGGAGPRRRQGERWDGCGSWLGVTEGRRRRGWRARLPWCGWRGWAAVVPRDDGKAEGEQVREDSRAPDLLLRVEGLRIPRSNGWHREFG
jgi:hypothetical protein